MNYKSNFGNSYDYNAGLGYSNVSRGYNKMSFRNPGQQHGGIGQVQFMLENQRKKFRQTKDRFQADLDNQRKKRIQFQNKLIKLKDQFSRKQVVLSEAQFKINNLLHQNQDLAVENDRLKHELARLEQLYGGKIHELQTQLNLQTKNFEQTTLQYNEEFDKFKKEGQQYVEQLTFEMERKIKGLQQKIKSLQMVKRDLSSENKKLNDLIISNRLQFQQQIRDIKNRARDQQIKKAQSLTKTYEQKLKMAEQGKQGLSRKIQQLIRVIQDKESKINDYQRYNEEQMHKLRQDNADLSQQINQLNYLLSKVKNQLAQKDNMIGRSVNGNESQLKMLKQQLQDKKKQISQLQSSVRDLRMTLKDLQADSERKRRDLTERCYAFQSQAKKYREDYNRLTQILKSKINNTIDNVSYTKKQK